MPQSDTGSESFFFSSDVRQSYSKSSTVAPAFRLHHRHPFHPFPHVFAPMARTTLTQSTIEDFSAGAPRAGDDASVSTAGSDDASVSDHEPARVEDPGSIPATIPGGAPADSRPRVFRPVLGTLMTAAHFGPHEYVSDAECSEVTITTLLPNAPFGVYLQPRASFAACCVHKQRRLMFGNSRTPLLRCFGVGAGTILKSWYSPTIGVDIDRPINVPRSPALPACALHSCCGVLAFVPATGAPGTRASLLFLRARLTTPPTA